MVILLFLFLLVHPHHPHPHRLSGVVAEAVSPHWVCCGHCPVFPCVAFPKASFKLVSRCCCCLGQLLLCYSNKQTTAKLIVFVTINNNNNNNHAHLSKEREQNLCETWYLISLLISTAPTGTYYSNIQDKQNRIRFSN